MQVFTIIKKKYHLFYFGFIVFGFSMKSEKRDDLYKITNASPCGELALLLMFDKLAYRSMNLLPFWMMIPR